MNDVAIVRTPATPALFSDQADGQAPIQTEYFIQCMRELADLFDANISAGRIQIMIDLFRQDGWKTYEFRLACQDLARTQYQFPLYAAFNSWRKNQ